MGKRRAACIFFLLIFTTAHAQFRFQLVETDGSNFDKVFRRAYKIPDAVVDSIDGVRVCKKILPLLYADGYLAATIDSIYIRDSTFHAVLQEGSIYKWAQVTTDTERDVLVQSGADRELGRGKTITAVKLSAAMLKILKWYGGNGYPFASVHLDSVKLENNKVYAVLHTLPGEAVYFDSLIIKGNSQLSNSYLSNYLGLKKGALYHEARVEKISNRLREIPFITERQRHDKEFSGNKIRIIIYIDDKKASTFSGVAGILPDNVNPGKINVTGDIKLRLLNSFNHAELFDLNWSNPLPKSQDLKIKLNYPFLFDFPFGLDVNLNLFKKDTTFLELERELGIQHYLQGNNYIKVYASLVTSDLISVVGYENATTLPEFADVRTTTYGVGWKFEKLDYRLNPRRGYSVEAQAGAGTKVITRNSKINKELYDSLDLRTNNYNGRGQGDIYIPVASRGVVNIGASGGWLFSPDIFENELYRFGGLKTLRGFNELSINASQYIIGKLEYRYILDENSFLFLFGNMSYYENRSRNNFIHDAPYGYGGGINFSTKLGIFSFTYALGKQFDNPVLLKEGKVHFGIVNFF